MTSTPTVPTSGFDIFMTKGTDRVVNLNPTPPAEGEEPVVEPYTPTWDSVQLDITGGEPELNGYRYQLQYWETLATPGVDPITGDPTVTYSKVYPSWIIASQTITKKSPSRQVFFTDTGDELFPTPAGVVTSTSAVGGITDGTKYSYLLVFDQAEVEWLPRCSTYKQPFVTKGTPPNTIINPSLPYPKYPMDSLGAFDPDPREEVTITYEVTTLYQLVTNGPVYTFTFTIPQVCTQDPFLSGDKLQQMLDKCYFTHGFYHVQLYDVEAPANYDEYGNKIGEVIEPIYLKNETTSELVGFDVYELQNSVWNENGMENIPEEEAASEIARKEVIEEGQKQIEGLEDTMASTQADYEAEIASIEAAQREYAEAIKLNEQRKDKLLSNIQNMIKGVAN